MDSEGHAELIAGCVGGDDRATARFYSAFRPLVLRTVRKRIVELQAQDTTREDAEDIAHEIFERLFDKQCARLARIDNPEVITAWLVTVSRNHVVTWLRRKNAQGRVGRRLAEEPAEHYGQTPETQASAREETRLLRARMDELGAEERLVLDLYFSQDLKYAEIAALLGMNINTVAAKLRRARAKLKKLLEKDLR